MPDPPPPHHASSAPHAAPPARPAPAPLPVDALLPEVRAALRAGPALILTAPPGAGKTTRVPPALLGEPWLAGQQVVLLQPRRVAARACTARIAAEHGWRVGEEVGYQIRFENRTSPRTRLRVVTEGILTQWLAREPFLEGVGCVVLDEFHERSLHADLALALLRELQRTVRPELRLVVMSATLDAAPLRAYLGGAPVLASAGRMFPVELEFLPRSDPRPMWDQAAEAILATLNRPSSPQPLSHSTTQPLPPGHMLVFLPGMGEIRRTAERVRGACAAAGAALHLLHGSVPAAEQDAALAPSAARKVILATNLAETSLTIDGVTQVIDSGWARVAQQDAALGIDRLELRRISQASATQRAGRAGRTGPGRCLRLWTRGEDAALPPHETPEVRRVDLAQALLAMKSFGVGALEQFEWFEPPRPDALARSVELLGWLGALDARGVLTARGGRLARLPLHPRLGAIAQAGAAAGLAREAARLAALLQEGDWSGRAAAGPGGRALAGQALAGECDLLDRAEELAAASPSAARAAEQIERLLREVKPARGRKAPDEPAARLRWALLHGYPDRVTLRREPGSPRGRMVGGRGVVLAESSCVRTAELFLSLDPRDVAAPGGASGAEARVSLASAIEPEWLGELFPHLLRRERAAEYDPARGRVMWRVRTLFIDLPIEEHTTGARAGEGEVAAALRAALGGELNELLLRDAAAAAWLGRVACLRRAMPELALPDFTAEALEPVLLAACSRAAGRAELAGLDWRALLDAALTPTQRAALAREAPEALPVPSGSRIRLDYTQGDAPVLAARLQELFGLAETPRVAAGSVPVVLHLLAPNQRPVQVTRDLRSFWNTTYAEVRRDLRARYPKHPWPEDPRNAPAVAVGRRKR